MSANKCVLCAEIVGNDVSLCEECIAACDNHPNDKAFFVYLIGRASPPENTAIPSVNQLRQSLKTLEINQRRSAIEDMCKSFAHMISNNPQSDSWTTDIPRTGNSSNSRLAASEVASRLTSLGYIVSVDNYRATITARLPDEVTEQPVSDDGKT